MEVSNNSKDTILWVPELLYFKVLYNDSKETEIAKYAVNPEEIVLDFDKKRSKKKCK